MIEDIVVELPWLANYQVVRGRGSRVLDVDEGELLTKDVLIGVERTVGSSCDRTLRRNPDGQ